MKNTRKLRHPVSTESLETRRLLTSAISFAAHVDFTAGTTPVALVAADFNGDGNQDVAVADSAANRILVFFGNGSGGFSAGPVLALSSPPSHVITGDFNGDGKPDIAVGCTAGVGQLSSSVDVFLNGGGGNFALGQITTVQLGIAQSETVPLAAGDFNRDGHLDVAVGDFSNESVSILLGTGTGTFAAPLNYEAPAHPTAIAVADFNNDTYPDLAVTSTLSDNSTGTTVTSNSVAIFVDSAGANFSAGPNIQISLPGIATGIAAANLTAAATPGLAVGFSNGNAALLTNSGGSFSQSAQPNLAAGSTSVAVSDFDLDGKTDLVSSDGGSSTSTSANSITIVQGAGSGGVGNSFQFTSGGQPSDVVVADFNNDGKPDVATSNLVGGTVSVLLNTTAIPTVSTKTVLTADNASAPAGTAVNLTATITPAGVSVLTGEEVPKGSVNFFDGTHLLSTVTLTGSATQAVFSTADLMVGTHRLRAVYSGDPAYSGGNSAVIVETITPTATQGPDLVGTFVSSTLPSTVAPGENGIVSIRLTNQGNTTAIGSITNSGYLSLDNLIDAGDTSVLVRGALAKANVHLKPGQSTTLKGTLIIPQNVSLASYYFLASLNPSDSLPESVPDNNLVTSPAPFTVADEFGTVGGRKNVVLNVSDNNGTPATFRLSGPGTATLNMGDNGVDLVVDGTTAASTLTVTTKGAAVFQLHDFTANTTLRSVVLPKVNVGDAITLIGGATTVSLGAVTGNMISTGGIRSLTVTRWTGGCITAPWISSIRSIQNFTPDLQLSGIGAPAAAANNTITASGGIGGAWTISGLIKSISATSASSLSITTGTINKLQVRGSVASSTITASMLLRSLLITGAVDDSTKFSATTFGKAIIGGAVVNSATDSHFLLI